MRLNGKVPNFLKKLVVNNNREWFNDNKDLYIEAKTLFEEFIEYQIQEISKFDSQVKGLQVKDSSFRIYRDVRFSKDKTPYKIHFSAYMAAGGRKSPYAGYYTHIEPDANLIAGGLHHPHKDILYAIRSKIYEKPQVFKNIIEHKDFKRFFPKIYGERLKTAPKGFDKNFSDIELIQPKSYDFFKFISDDEILKEDYSNKSMEAFQSLIPLNKYFNEIINKSGKNL